MSWNSASNRRECVILEAVGKGGNKKYELHSFTTHLSVAWKVARSLNDTEVYKAGKATNEFEVCYRDEYEAGKIDFVPAPKDFDYEYMTEEYEKRRSDEEATAAARDKLQTNSVTAVPVPAPAPAVVPVATTACEKGLFNDLV